MRLRYVTSLSKKTATLKYGNSKKYNEKIKNHRSARRWIIKPILRVNF